MSWREMESKNIKQLISKKRLDKYNVIDYICTVFNSGGQTVMLKIFARAGMEADHSILVWAFFML